MKIKLCFIVSLISFRLFVRAFERSVSVTLTPQREALRHNVFITATVQTRQWLGRRGETQWTTRTPGQQRRFDRLFEEDDDQSA